MLTPEISVIIPLYNKERYVQRAVNSVLEQSLAPLEVVVVDDGSTDGSAAAVAALGPDPRLRLVSQRNQGASAARNRGVTEARGRFVAFLDADDQWQPEFLETLQWLRELFPEGCFFATGFEVIYSDGSRRVRDLGLPEFCLISLTTYLDCCSRVGSPVMSSAVMVEKELLTRVGMFPVGQRRGEDLDTWVRLLCEVPLVYCSKPGAVVWDALPASACVACNDIYVDGNRVLEMLEEMAAGTGCPAEEREIIHDYLAWYLAGPVERLLAARQGAWARRYIVPALRSRRFRMRFLGMYVKSLLVQWAP